MGNNEAKSLIGCCGIYCGLCSKYQSTAKSRCIGCKLGEQHSWCSIWNCCVKKHGFETCIECKEVFQCKIFSRRKVTEWIPAANNLLRIKEVGLKRWLEEQSERQALLERLLQHYNEGRSMSFYCKACARMQIALINAAIKEATKKLASEKVDKADIKSKANVVKKTIRELASTSNVDLS
ncbi:MAG: DUF3795 domain-containing protein [Methanomicrobia archaeon]|nr:DUF3795 domain-containing protein [Methanomicrobia archaeon]